MNNYDRSLNLGPLLNLEVGKNPVPKKIRPRENYDHMYTNALTIAAVKTL